MDFILANYVKERRKGRKKEYGWLRTAADYREPSGF